jgi:hypothetical protein
MLPQDPTPPKSSRGGPRPGAGRPSADYTRTKLNIELPQPLIDKWDEAAKKHGSRAKALAHLLKWKWPK